MTITEIGVVIADVFLIIYILNKYIKFKSRKTIKKIAIKNFKNSIIKPAKTVNERNLKKKLGLFDLDIYNDVFEENIRKRGQLYYANGKLENVCQHGNGWHGITNGTHKYDVCINFENDKIIDTKCNCPYYLENNKNCKHIYALLIKAKGEKNLPIIKEAINNYSQQFNKMIDEEFEFIKKHLKRLNMDEDKLTELKINTKHLIVTTKNTKKSIENNKLNETYLFRLLVYLIQDSYRFKQKLKETIEKQGKTNNPALYNTKNDEKEDLKETLLEYYILKKSNEKENEIDEELEKEMDSYMLADWEKDLVRSGEYKPWNFDEDNEEEMAQWGKYDKLK